eukprot:XP_011682331.1 PREDICTED: transient-receptor-potential-like protein [Strongylocentrotus purpuratus]
MHSASSTTELNPHRLPTPAQTPCRHHNSHLPGYLSVPGLTANGIGSDLSLISGVSNIPLQLFSEGQRITVKEREFLEAAEKGDKATIVRCVQGENPVNVNVSNLLGRSALQMAVDNENLEIVELLLAQPDVEIGDALLQAIREGVYRMVEMMVNHPSISRQMLGEGWASANKSRHQESSDYSPDISPVILAAHCNQFEILQLLLTRGATIYKPHPCVCACAVCEEKQKQDSLRYSLDRINTYRALASPAWISLTSCDPVLTAFKLSWELQRLAMRENEFKDIYVTLSGQAKAYAVDLLEQCRSSEEVIALLDKQSMEDDDDEGYGADEMNSGKLTLSRLKLALKYDQKQRLPKQVLFSQLPAGERGIGRPRLRYKDTIKRNLKRRQIETKTWTTAAGQRAVWRTALFSEGQRITVKEREFLEAAEKGDKATIVRCVQGENPVNVNVSNLLGRSALQMAVDNENLEIVELLLAQPDVEIGDALLQGIFDRVVVVEWSYAVDLLEQCRSSEEVIALLDKQSMEDDDDEGYGADEMNSGKLTLSRLKLALKYDQKQFVAHPHTQQLLASIWYEGLPGWRRRNWFVKSLICCALICLFPLMAIYYLIFPRTPVGTLLRSPFMKFLNHSASFIFFLFLLVMASSSVSATSDRGRAPDTTEVFILVFVLGMIWAECKQLWEEGLRAYIRQWWNWLDFIMLSLYLCTFSLRLVAAIQLSRGVYNDGLIRTQWSTSDPTLVSEGVFAIANVFSFARIIYLFQFVAHPHTQQLLASIWYEGLPGWRRRNWFVKSLICCALICLFPLMAIYYLIFPRTPVGTLLRSPFMKFLNHSASFIFFLFLLVMASSSVSATSDRGRAPDTTEVFILVFVLGMIWAECKQLWEEGLRAYIRQWWNWLDFIMLSLYLCTFSLRLVAAIQLSRGVYNDGLIRTQWSTSDPTLVSEGVFAIANVFSFARIIYLFQANPYLGPLQISLGCMLIDIAKFLLIFFLVLCSFACGLNKLYSDYLTSFRGSCKDGADEKYGSEAKYCSAVDKDFDGFVAIRTPSSSSFYLVGRLPGLGSGTGSSRANPYLGPLQISLGCMLIDIAKFLLIFFLVLCSFACGLNKLYSDYLTSFRGSCKDGAEEKYGSEAKYCSAVDKDFDGLPRTLLTLLWALFGLVQNTAPKLDKENANNQFFVEQVGELLFLVYHLMSIIVLLNMLIAMMSSSFQIIEDHADREWKFARSKLWMSYFDEGSTLPPPFNLIISPKSILYATMACKRIFSSRVIKSKHKPKPRRGCSMNDSMKNVDGSIGPNNTPEYRYQDVMKRLVNRYIHQCKAARKADGVNEDDLNEIKQDISSLRYELREDRKKEEARGSSNMHNIRRDIIRIVRSTSSTTEQTSTTQDGRSQPGSTASTESLHSLSRDTSSTSTSTLRPILLGSTQGSAFRRFDGAGGRGSSNANQGTLNRSYAQDDSGLEELVSRADLETMKRDILQGIQVEVQQCLQDVLLTHRHRPSIDGPTSPPPPVPPPPLDVEFTDLPPNDEHYFAFRNAAFEYDEGMKAIKNPTLTQL